jgi:hypothetical protein
MEGSGTVVPRSKEGNFNFNARKKEGFALWANFSGNYNPINQVLIKQFKNHQKDLSES